MTSKYSRAGKCFSLSFILSLTMVFFSCLHAKATHHSGDHFSLLYNNMLVGECPEQSTMVCTGNVTLNSQADVDAFDCTEITGNLFIGGSGSNITDLNPLSMLTSVGGALIIENNGSLENFDGLNGLGAVSGFVLIENNDALLNIDGLSSLASIGDNFSIRNNALLNNVDGLSALQNVQGWLWIFQNDGIENLDGLSALTAVGDFLGIDNNDALVQVDGLSSLVSVGAEVAIERNDALENLDGLSGLTSVVDWLFVLNNISLTNIDGLSNIASIGNNLWIRDNISLSACCGIFPLIYAGGAPADILLENNGDSCNSLGDLFDNCIYLFSVDLELTASSETAAFDIYQQTTVKFHIENTGNTAATGVTVQIPEPEGTVFVGGNEYLATQGTFSPYYTGLWTVGTLEVGASADIYINLFTLQNDDPLLAYAQVMEANELDLDSFTGNGSCCSANEDDEAVLEIVPYCAGDISLNSQAEVDAFPPCTVWDGDIYIGSSDDITDLTPLLGLKEITGNLIVNLATNLLNLNGLEGITKIGGDLVIVENEDIVNIDGLTNLVDFDGRVTIERNPKLEQIDGLHNISAAYSILIIENPALEDLNGLGNLTSVWDLEIIDNDMLEHLDALTGITSMGNSLILDGNDGLQNVDGVLNLTSLGNELYIGQNAALENLDGLSQLTFVGGSSLPVRIVENDVLSDCCGIYPLLQSGTLSAPAVIENNPAFCSSASEIIDNCMDEYSVDLALTASSASAEYYIYTNLTIKIQIENTGNVPATGVTVQIPQPAGTVFVGGNEYFATQGYFNPYYTGLWTVGSLAPGATADIYINLFTLQDDNPVLTYAQVMASNEPDLDSTPGNGSPPVANEDDEVAFSVPAANALNRSSTGDDAEPVFVKSVYPVPVTDQLNVVMETADAARIEARLYDVRGVVVKVYAVAVTAGSNHERLDTSDLPEGVYQLVLELPERRVVRFVK